MASPIVKPEIPYNGEISDGVSPGKMVRIQGVTHPNSDRFNINLQTGPNAKPRDDTALHLSVRLNQGYIARNTYIDGTWGDEQGSGSLPIGPAQSFEILILIDPDHYKVAVNGQHFCEFPHRIPLEKVSHLLIDGDVSITLISWEGAVPSAPPSDDVTASLASQVNAASGPDGGQYGPPPGGPGSYGPPPGGPGGYGPPPGGPGGYGPPAGGYGPPPNYGYGSQPGYGPPPPPGGQPEESGFWSQAQEVLAGAIASGAAEKLLGGLLSSSGEQQQQPQGYAPQNAKYGIYPELPRDDLTSGPKDNKPAPGPIESLLSGLLSNRGHQGSQENQPPTQGRTGEPNPLQNILSSIISGNNQNSQGNLPNQGNQIPPQQYQSTQPPSQGGPQTTTPQGGQQHTPGPLESLLTSLLSGSGQRNDAQPGTFPPQVGQPQNLPPQPPQQGAAGDQQYGQYPHGPPPQQQEQRGPVESLLSGLLSSGGQQQGGYQQPHGPQVGGQGSVGGLGSMGSILSSLAGSVLRPNQNH